MATVAVRAAVRLRADVAASDRALRDVDDDDAATATREVRVAGYTAVGDANMTMKYTYRCVRPSVYDAVGRARVCRRVSTCVA